MEWPGIYVRKSVVFFLLCQHFVFVQMGDEKEGNKAICRYDPGTFAKNLFENYG